MIKFLIRLYRKLTCKCVVCGRPTYYFDYWYCSFECMGYDGCFSVKINHPNNKKKPSLFRGYVDNYKDKHNKYI